MPLAIPTQDSSAGATDSSSTTKPLLDLIKDQSKPAMSERAVKLAAGEPLEERDLPVFPTERQPYWKDRSVNVVTETYSVLNPHGGWIVKKKKYLEYPDGRMEGL